MRKLNKCFLLLTSLDLSGLAWLSWLNHPTAIIMTTLIIDILIMTYHRAVQVSGLSKCRKAESLWHIYLWHMTYETYMWHMWHMTQLCRYLRSQSAGRLNHCDPRCLPACEQPCPCICKQPRLSHMSHMSHISYMSHISHMAPKSRRPKDP